MAGLYRVTKTIKGHKYIYEQQTYREKGVVRTRNRYIGPAGGGGASALGGTSHVSSTTTWILNFFSDFGKGMIKQFDVERWAKDATTQLGLTPEPAVTTTKHRRRKKILIGYRDGKRYFGIAKGSRYEHQKPPSDEVWLIFG